MKNLQMLWMVSMVAILVGCVAGEPAGGASAILQIDLREYSILVWARDASPRQKREIAATLRAEGVKPLVFLDAHHLVVADGPNVRAGALAIDAEVLVDDEDNALQRVYSAVAAVRRYRGVDVPVDANTSASAQDFEDDLVMPHGAQAELRESTQCRYWPNCFLPLRGLTAVGVAFVESVASAPLEHETWLPRELRAADARYLGELLALARVAPASAELTFDFLNLGSFEVSGEPTAGFGYESAYAEMAPSIERILQVESQACFNCSAVERIERNLASPYRARGYDGFSLLAIARDFEAPFADRALANWWPSAELGAPFARSLEGPRWQENAVFTHELLHTFGTLDQYYRADAWPDACMSTFDNAPSELSYLAVRLQAAGGPVDVRGRVILNGNAEGCTHFEHTANDIMNDNSVAQAPFFRPLLSWFTRAQLGWGDTSALGVAYEGVPRRTARDTPEISLDGTSFYAWERFSYASATNTRVAGRDVVRAEAEQFASALCISEFPTPASPADVADQRETIFHPQLGADTSSPHAIAEGRVVRVALPYRAFTRSASRSCSEPPPQPSAPRD